ncbi:MAG: CBS domain-containing protein [Proteobacteria bacterium]|nr:MAG: CBS domain-containing protein [Pseudomonadota bacterium]QKK12145.1 MAG: CBS domain-containing protein [Pseudomonadota bacterium]
MALKSNTSVLDAARAIEHNNIGAVVVQDKGNVVGIVTDRDLAIRALGRGLDPHKTTVGEVMTAGVVSLAPTDTQASAIRLMQKRNIRRIPLVEGGRFVGMVTLDDLLLDEAAPIDRLAAIVEAQIGEGGPAGTDRSPARRRSAARAEATYRRVINQLRADTDLENDVQTETALGIVLDSLVRRLIPGEAEDLIAQLPSLLQPALYALPLGPDKLITRETIEQELVQQLGVDPSRAAKLLAAAGALIAQTVSTGQMEDVRGQLPESLREVFLKAPVPAAS